MEEIGYAKINLALHVRAREQDGYHRIETIFAFAEDGDRLRVAEGEGLSLEVTGPFADDLAGEADNLVLCAAQALRERCSVDRGAALTLDKRLPVAAGLGGGSADAAAALRLLDRWWGLHAEEGLLLDIAATLGADVPACLLSRTIRGEGRGDRLVGIDDDRYAAMPLLIVNPRLPLPTGPVFAAWDGIDRGPLDNPFHGRNDLEAPAISLVPDIEQALARLAEAPGALLSRMSGSGASCFALFESEAARDVAQARIAAHHPRWWQLKTRIR
jgi:4-diphosphocytidyl-2-C-methyl-D-erythritol kinase